MIYTKTECKDATKGPPVLYEDSTLEKCKELCNQGLGVFILLFPCILIFFYCEGNLKNLQSYVMYSICVQGLY